MSFAVFIEPQDELRESIITWKNRIASEFPGQPYCSHPPHCTLIHAEVNDEQAALVSTRDVFWELSSFEVSINQIGVFWNDAATGGNTLYLKINPEVPLQDLQIRVAGALKPVIQKTEAPNYILDNSVLLESFQSYGFPFIGPHWIPHLSIASLKLEHTHPLIKEFTEWKPDFSMRVAVIGCWRVLNDKHSLLGRQNCYTAQGYNIYRHRKGNEFNKR